MIGEKRAEAIMEDMHGDVSSNKRYDTFINLKKIDSRQQLAEEVAREVLKYSIYDMQKISAHIEREINLLPSPYKEKIRPYFIQQIFGAYYRIMSMHGNGGFKSLGGEIKYLEKFKEFCQMAANYKPDTTMDELFDGMYYHLLSCFAMFALEEPGHPVGMPFPGGFSVQIKDGKYYCPIRDKEKDVEHSICNFCPAHQEEMPSG